MTPSRWTAVAALVLLAAGCGEGAGPVASTLSTARLTTAVPSPGEAVTLLVADGSGIRLWSGHDGVRTVLARPAAVALPDRLGGLVFQEAETGRWDQQLTDGTVRWQWVGTGAPQPIKWMASPGAAEQVVVTAPAGASLHALDVALAGGRPALAYLRIRRFEVPGEEVFASAIAELVVRDLSSGQERVVRSQQVGWEFDDRVPALGDDLVIDVIGAYSGEFHTVAFFDRDGGVLAPPYEPPDATTVDPVSGIRDWCGGEQCELRVDLAPVGPQLASVRLTGPMGTAQDAPRQLEVVVIDRRTGDALTRATTTVPASSFLAPSLDTVGGRTLVSLATWEVSATDGTPVVRFQDPLLVEPGGAIRTLDLVSEPMVLAAEQTAWPSLRIWTA